MTNGTMVSRRPAEGISLQATVLARTPAVWSCRERHGSMFLVVPSGACPPRYDIHARQGTSGDNKILPNQGGGRLDAPEPENTLETDSDTHI